MDDRQFAVGLLLVLREAGYGCGDLLPCRVALGSVEFLGGHGCGLAVDVNLDLVGMCREVVALVRLSFLVQSIYAEICAKHDLSPAQAQLLCVIKDCPRGMTELSRMLRLERPGPSGLVDRIERRAVTLSPTSRGKGIVEAFYAEVSDRLTGVVAHLPPGDRRQFERIATKIVQSECVPAVFGGADEPPANCERR